MTDHKPVLLLPGHQSADAADEFFAHAYECASWHDDDGQPYSNGRLAPYAGRKVDVWGAPRNKVDAEPVLTELHNLGCEIRYIDMTGFALEPYAAFVAAMEPNQLFDFVKRELKPYDLAAKPGRRRIKWTELAGKVPPEREWLIGHWLTRGATLLAGQGGIGKTHIVQTLATAIATGSQYIDSISKAHRVLFWACEDDRDELWRRQISINSMFGTSMSDLDNLIIEPRIGMDNGLMVEKSGAPLWMDPIKNELRSQINDYAASVLILDNIGQCFGGNENSRHHVTAFISGLMGLSARPLSIILLGHPAKAAGSEFSGSTAWEAAVRMRWYLGKRLPDQPEDEDESPIDTNVRFLCKRKSNYSQLDYRQLTWSNGAYNCATPEPNTPSFRDKYASGARSEYARQLVMAAVKQFYDAGMRVTASPNSPHYVISEMRTIKICQDYTMGELKEALAALRLEGKIIEAPVGKYGNRSQAMGLAPIGSI